MSKHVVGLVGFLVIVLISLSMPTRYYGHAIADVAHSLPAQEYRHLGIEYRRIIYSHGAAPSDPGAGNTGPLNYEAAEHTTGVAKRFIWRIQTNIALTIHILLPTRITSSIFGLITSLLVLCALLVERAMAKRQLVMQVDCEDPIEEEPESMLTWFWALVWFIPGLLFVPGALPTSLVFLLFVLSMAPLLLFRKPHSIAGSF